MQHQELARHLSVNPSEIVYAVTMETVLSAIVKRMGKDALSLTMEEIELAKEEIKAAIEKIYGVPVRVNIEEVKKPDLHAKLVAENIAHQLERRMSFRRAIKSASAASMRAGAKGIRIEVAGRLNGAEMSRREKEAVGSVPLHTIRADIDFASVQAQTIAGVIGVKVWIYKGEK